MPLFNGIGIRRLIQHYPHLPYPLHVHVQRSDMFNAVTLPAGHIVVFTGLLENIDDENELAFVLAHELGHIHHRDHLKSMGRGIIFLMASTAMLGSDSTVSQVVSQSVNITDRQFSQTQEKDADRFALHLLSASYHHVGDSVTFFLGASAKGRVLQA
jgi:Zn-dependent protease with chaperone function